MRNKFEALYRGLCFACFTILVPMTGHENVFAQTTPTQNVSSSRQLRLDEGQETAASTATEGDIQPSQVDVEKTEEAVPALDIRTLFHPKDRVSFFGPVPPTTKWLENNKLAIERGERWEILDPETGKKQDWEFPVQLRDALRQVPGIPRQDLDAAARRAVETLDSLDSPVLINVGRAIVVVDTEWQATLVTRDSKGWSTPSLSPDGKSIAYVQDSDLYVVKVESGEVRRLTQSGSVERLNGRLDWTYQEEIYGRGNFKGFWWSPDSRHIAYLSIDTSDVLDFTLTTSDTPRGSTLVSPYPKAGDPIPLAELWVVDSETLQSTSIHLPVGDESESIVARVTWRPDGHRLTYQIQNRIQTWLELREHDIARGESHVLLREEGPAWVEILGEPHWLASGDFLWLSDLPSGRRHVWLVAEDGSRRIPVTSGNWDVREIVSVGLESQSIFVTGDKQRGVIGQQLYRVSLQGGAQKSESVSVTEAPGWHVVSVAPNGLWFTDKFSSLTSEPVKHLRSVDGAQSFLLGPQSESSSVWKKLELAQPLWLEITTDDGVPLPAYVIPPIGVDLNNLDIRYPVLIETYGGPQSPSAVDRWNGREFLFRQLLAKQGIAVLVVDNRSSGGRGIADTWNIHRRVGVQELKDLLQVVDFLKQTQWADGDRLAVRGWSFGGCYTAYAMTHSTAFAAGVAGGSVTDWRNYDAFYTERYMDTPQNNPGGYRETSVIEKAQDLHGRLLLIHGEVDDNVHPGNTFQLIAELQEAGKQFDLMLYPGAAHGIRDEEQTYHMRKMVLDFLVRELKP